MQALIFAVHLNKNGLAGGACGFSYQEDRSCISQVVTLRSCKSHLRIWKISDPENEGDLISSRAGILETPRYRWFFTVCTTRRSNLGVGGVSVESWFRLNSWCRERKEVSGQGKEALSRFQTPIRELTSLYHRVFQTSFRTTLLQ